MCGQGLRNQLDKNSMTAYRLAQETGVDKGALSRILSGKSKYPALKVRFNLNQ